MSMKLIAIDIDGTLINDQHQITPAVKTAIQKKKAEGVKIVLCSGRPLIGMQALVKELGLREENQYTISYNGSLVQDNLTEEILVQHTLGYKDYVQFERLATELGVHFHVQDRQTMYTANREISPYTVFEAYATGIALEYRPADEMPQDIIISKMMMIDPPAILDPAIEQIPAAAFDDYHLVKSQAFFLEILNKKASKGRAVLDLAKHLGIQAHEIMAIGDNENDVDMLEIAEIGIAMGNGTENVKKAATHITKTNNQDGVAYALERWA